jgi:plastocyanin
MHILNAGKVIKMENDTKVSAKSSSTGPNKKMLIAVVIVVLIVAALVMMKAKKPQTNVPEESQMVQDGAWDPDADSSINAPTIEITVTEDGFSPNSITVDAGTAVVWNNTSGDTVNVSSAPHPAHTDFPFLNLGDLSAGDKFSLVFDTPGTYKYHNHLDSSKFGTIVVLDVAQQE